MAYAIMRINKCKPSAVGGLQKHHEREKEKYKSNPDIDLTRSQNNFHIKSPPVSYKAFINERIQEEGCKVRKDSVVMQDSFCTASPDFFQGRSLSDISFFFRWAYRFYAETFGEKNIISAVVHLDEKTPHMHICFVPITKDGRLSSKAIIGGPQGLVKLQDMFYEHMARNYPTLKRGIPKRLTQRKHLPVYLFKNADFLMEHFDDISQAINNIGLINNKEKKAQAIKLLTSFAPEMAKVKEQMKSVNDYVDSLNNRIVDEKQIGQYWKGKTEELQDALKERDDKIFDLQAKQKKLESILGLIPPELLAAMEAEEKEKRRKLREKGLGGRAR